VTATREAEVLVVGGGPAGAACALTLAKLGRDVVLCEAARFPRDHVGISLSPGVVNQLDFLGIRDILKHPAHLPAVPVELRWGTSHFTTAPLPAFIANRGQLDQDLLAAAADHGVRILQPAKVNRLIPSGCGWTGEMLHPSGPRTVRAAYVVDARGRSSRNNPPRTWLGPATIALRGTWRGHANAVVRIGTGVSSWSWAAPIGDSRRVAIAFTNPRTLRQMGGSLRERYVRLLDEAGVSNPDLALEYEPQVCDATPFVREDASRKLLRTGDADAALDPLSSSGVQAAIQSGLRAGPVVNTLLTPSSDGTAAMEYWNARRSAQAMTRRSWSADRYAEAFQLHPTEFWRVRAEHAMSRSRNVSPRAPLPLPDQTLQLSDKARFEHTPCLVGGLIVRATSLSHPNLPEAVAFVDGVPLHAILASISKSETAAELISAWRSMFSPEKALAVLSWLWRNEITIAATEAPPCQAHCCEAKP
jgi:flavin-dependent dehydrogenase